MDGFIDGTNTAHDCITTIILDRGYYALVMGGSVDRINTTHNASIIIRLDLGVPDLSARCYAFRGTSDAACNYRGVAGGSGRAEHRHVSRLYTADRRMALQRFFWSSDQRFTSGWGRDFAGGKGDPVSGSAGLVRAVSHRLAVRQRSHQRFYHSAQLPADGDWVLNRPEAPQQVRLRGRGGTFRFPQEIEGNLAFVRFSAHSQCPFGDDADRRPPAVNAGSCL